MIKYHSVMTRKYSRRNCVHHPFYKWKCFCLYHYCSICCARFENCNPFYYLIDKSYQEGELKIGDFYSRCRWQKVRYELLYIRLFSICNIISWLKKIFENEVGELESYFIFTSCKQNVLKILEKKIMYLL